MQGLLAQGLLITVIGMGLVFGALAVLWGIMALMGGPLSSSISESRPDIHKEPVPVRSDHAAGLQPSDEELAAIAVALARLKVEREAEEAIPWRLPPVLTRWVAVGYGRQLHSWQPPRFRKNA